MSTKEKETRERCSMDVKLEIMGAYNVAVKPLYKGTLFVRYYLDQNIAVDSKEVEASSEPQWRQTFCLKCGGGRGINEIFHAMQSETVVFEVRWRRRGRILRGVKSKVVGRVEIPWKELLVSPSLSIDGWFPLHDGDLSRELQLPTPTLQLSLSLVLPRSLATQIHQHEVDKISHKAGTKDSSAYLQAKKCRSERRNMQRRMRCLERDECGCGGRVCMAQYDANVFGEV